MARTMRAIFGRICCHVLNRGNARREVFLKDGDYQAFLKAHGDLSRSMHWLEHAHIRPYHQHYHPSGHLWQWGNRGKPGNREVTGTFRLLRQKTNAKQTGPF